MISSVCSGDSQTSSIRVEACGKADLPSSRQGRFSCAALLRHVEDLLILVFGIKSATVRRVMGGRRQHLAADYHIVRLKC